MTLALYRSARAVALISGLSVVGAFMLGSIPIGYLLTRWELRRDVRRFDNLGETRPGAETEIRSILTGRNARGAEPERLPRWIDLAGAGLDTVKVVAVAIGVGLLVHRVAPGVHRGDLPTYSAIGFVSDQVLLSWQSAALWAGLAAAVGHLCPVYLGFRLAQGQAPALGLAVLFCPFGFSVAVAAFFLALAVTRHVRPAVLVSLPAFAAYAWVAWIADLPHSWGVPNGPELALWSAGMAGVIGVRTLSRTGIAGGAPA